MRINHINILRQYTPTLLYCARRALLISLFLLCACAGHDAQPTPEKTGYTESQYHFNAEAQKLFAKTRVMWDINEKCSDPALAMEYLDAVITMEPQYADAYMRRALAASELGYWDEAFEDSSRAIRLEPKADNYAYRGLIFMRQGNYTGSRKDLRKAQSITPRNVNAKVFLKQLDELQGK